MNNYDKSAKQRIAIDILKQYYSESSTQFNRELDSMQLRLDQSEREKQEAMKQFHLLSRNLNYNNESLDYHITQQNNRLFKTAKYALNGYETQSLNQESQYLQELPYISTNVAKPKKEPSVQTVIIKGSKVMDEQSKIFFQEENNIHSQSIINIMNDLSFHRRVQTTQDRPAQVVEIVKSKPYKTEGQSASVSFTKEIQKNEPLLLEQQYERINHIEFNQKEQINKDEKIDIKIDDLLQEIQDLVGNGSKNLEQTLISQKLKNQTERNNIQLVLDKGENFKPVSLLNTQIILKESKLLDSRVKEENLNNLDKLILDLCI
ncbi:unnamed protein product [Paramecium sonneborni]|uniref:Uncharacterized protein n=1 Tax=Paramecium sonneborni TaxID=65129 RepID=A0A8S1Q128_9CILI|nr:unnamed protein product [Paramecium sonneborni]